MRQGRNRSRLRPDAHRLDESAASYSLAGCSPAEPASASPAGFNAGPNGRNSQPPLQRGWGIFDRRFGEFSTGVDNETRTNQKNRGLPAQIDRATMSSSGSKRPGTAILVP